jgi:hypothetical protein
LKIYRCINVVYSCALEEMILHPLLHLVLHTVEWGNVTRHFWSPYTGKKKLQTIFGSFDQFSSQMKNMCEVVPEDEPVCVISS